jgi:hypothetical protein
MVRFYSRQINFAGFSLIFYLLEIRRSRLMHDFPLADFGLYFLNQPGQKFLSNYHNR